MIFLHSATTNFDDYYFYVTGQRKTPVPKPTQSMPETMRQMLTELESYRPLRYLDIACAFLDMSFTTREDFVNTFVQQRQRTLQDQQLYDSTFHFEHKDTHITCMFAPGGTAPLIGEQAQATFRGRPRGRLGAVGSGKGCFRGRPRGRFGPTGLGSDRFRCLGGLGSTHGAGAILEQSSSETCQM